MRKSVIILTVILLLLWAITYPALHEYANSQRLMPGIGGEIIIPFGIIAIAGIVENWLDCREENSVDKD